MRPAARAALVWALLLASSAFAEDPPPAPAFTFRLLLSDLEPFGDRDARKAELFFGSVRATFERKEWGARAEVRGTEGRFRPYYQGSVWLEEGYAYAATPLGELRVGKLEREIGLPDESFGGTLFSLAGVTRNPDFGVGLAGHRDLGHDTLAWTVAWFGQNDRVAWEDDGYGVESDPLAKLRDAVSGRATYRWAVEFPWLVVTPGVSGESAHIVREDGLPDFRRNDLAAEVTGAVGPISLGLEAFTRSGESTPPPGEPLRLGYGDANAWMAAFTAEFPNVIWRYVYSEWRYPDAGANERQHLASAAWSPRKGIQGTIEVTGRRFRDVTGARTFNAVRFGLCLTF